MTLPLDQKVIFVTGASSGIGRATCLELARQGASVILLARHEEGLAETASLIPPERRLILPADMRDLATLPAVVEKAWQWQGRIDGLVYCVGAGGYRRLRDTTPDFMADLMQVNCFAFVEMLRWIMKLKKKVQPLRVAAISSFACLGHDKYYLAYAASKAALETAAKTLAVELLSRNTTINIIRPTFVDTPLVLNPLGDLAERIKENGYQPMGLIPPEEIAQMAAFLMGATTAHMTGTVIPINAGTPC